MFTITTDGMTFQANSVRDVARLVRVTSKHLASLRASLVPIERTIARHASYAPMHGHRSASKQDGPNVRAYCVLTGERRLRRTNDERARSLSHETCALERMAKRNA